MTGSKRSESTRRLWTLMQRVERCRHRAELADAKAESCSSPEARAEMAEVAQAWRDYAREIYIDGEAATREELSLRMRAPPVRTGRTRHFVLGAVVGALAGASLASPHWIEAITRFDPDRHSGTLEWTVTAAVALVGVGAVLSMRRTRRRPAADG